MLCTTDFLTLLCVSIWFSRRYMFGPLPVRRKTQDNQYGFHTIFLILAFVNTASYHSISCFCKVKYYEGLGNISECLRNCIQVIIKHKSIIKQNLDNISLSFTCDLFGHFHACSIVATIEHFESALNHYVQ